MYFELPGTNLRVMGSLHRLPADSPVLPPWSIAAYEWSEEVIFEAEPTALSLSHMQSPTGLNLKEHLSRATWAAIKRIWPNSSTLPPLEETKPWAVLIFGGFFSLRSVEGIEPIFQRKAGEDSKHVHFLENGDEMVAAFETAPLDDVVKSIELLVRDLSEPQRTLKKMYRAWVNENLELLGEVALHSPSLKLPSIRHAVIQKRNESWAHKIRGLMNSPTRTLVAVGALHLHGPGNLFDCLGHEINVLSNGD